MHTANLNLVCTVLLIIKFYWKFCSGVHRCIAPFTLLLLAYGVQDQKQKKIGLINKIPATFLHPGTPTSLTITKMYLYKSFGNFLKNIVNNSTSDPHQ